MSTPPSAQAPVVSIVIPAYNCSATLPATLQSVVAQTFQDWEVIVVDDASPEDVSLAMSGFAHDPRIRLARHPVNKGATAARNTGIAMAQGRFVAFLDSDDNWMPSKLQRQLDAVLAKPDPDKVFCVTKTIVNLADGRHVVRPVRAKRPDEPMDEFIFVSAGFCQTSSFFVSRAVARQIGFRELSTGEDHLFAIDACRAGAEYLLIDEPLAVYNDDIRPGRLSGDKTLLRGRAFMAEVQALISPKALAAYESRYLGALILRSTPLLGLRTIAKAIAVGALPPRFAIALVLRTYVPTTLYHRVRAAVLGRKTAVTQSG
jgi:glycosyltransferase involved in cell wall biosynthesis